MSDEPDPSLVAVMMTDVESSTALRNRLGDAASQDVLRAHESIVRDELDAHGGRDVKALGDGFLAWFPSVRSAVACAVEIQRAQADHNRDGVEPIRVRIGINAGEVVRGPDGIEGETVHGAERVASAAHGGEVFVSDVVRQLAGTIAGVSFVDRGRFRLRGFPERWRLHEVRADAAPDSRRDAFLAPRRAHIAGLLRRGTAAAVDLAIVTAMSIWIVSLEKSPSVSDITSMRLALARSAPRVALAIFGVLWFVGGLTITEWRWGRTPGKALLGLRVVSEDGRRISLGQAFLRRLPLWGGSFLQCVDWVFMWFGPLRQRAFDRLAGTIVIRD